MHPQARAALEAKAALNRATNSTDSWDNISQQAFETKCLSVFMREIKMPTKFRSRVDAVAKRHDRLHVGAFEEALSNFPFQVLVGKHGKLKEATRLDKIYKPKAMKELIESFEAEIELYAPYAGGRPQLLLTRLPYTAGMMCFHNTLEDPPIPGYAQTRLAIEGHTSICLESVTAVAIRFQEHLEIYYGGSGD